MQLYVMISCTDTGIGRLIRAVSRYPYNHVSVSIDHSLRQWVSFARYVQDTPLYGGLVSESPERFLGKGREAQVRIFRTEIPEEKYRLLEHLSHLTDRPEQGLMYNHLDALAGIFGCRVQIPGAFTCLGFVNRILDTGWLRIAQLDDALTPHLLYAGALSKLVSDSGRRDALYFTRLGPLRGTWNTAKQFFALASRMLGKGNPDVLVQ